MREWFCELKFIVIRFWVNAAHNADLSATVTHKEGYTESNGKEVGVTFWLPNIGYSKYTFCLTLALPPHVLQNSFLNSIWKMVTKQKHSIILFLKRRGAVSDVHRLQNMTALTSVHKWVKRVKEGEPTIKEKPQWETVNYDYTTQNSELAAKKDRGHKAIQDMVERGLKTVRKLGTSTLGTRVGVNDGSLLWPAGCI